MAFNVLKRMRTAPPCLVWTRLKAFLPSRAFVAFITLLAIFVPALIPKASFAQGARIMIRDAEIENIIRSLAVPLFQAAGLNPASVRIRLIQNKSLNAFVAGGQNIFIHTGLILNTKGPDALIGVIAHETGHIEGGHLVRTRAAIKEAQAVQLIGTILGTAAAVVAKRGDVGQAVIMGSQGAGARTFMKYSRTQESAADQAAMRLLDATERSGVGLEGFLGQLEGQEVLTQRFQDPYIRSHPLSRDRMDALAKYNQQSPYADKEPSKAEVLAYDRVVAKLYGYIEPLNKVLRRYPESDMSFAARYARAIAYYRAPDLKQALGTINALIDDFPSDAYLFELKGQMLFEHGRAAESYEAYTQAFRLAPNEALIAMELARVELEMDDPALLESAIEHFRLTTRLGGSTPFVWQQMSIAYGRSGNIGMSALARAEYELRTGQLSNAEFFATRATDKLKKGTSDHLQALDILQSIKVARDKAAAQ